MNNIDNALTFLHSGGTLGVFKQCPTCHRYDWVNSHQCPDRWEAIFSGYGNEANPESVYCDGNSTDAAQQFASQKFYRWDCPSNMEILVRKNSDGPWEKFHISTEDVLSFRAAHTLGDPA